MNSISRTDFSRDVRRRIDNHLGDESGMQPSGFAIYCLADPRELRSVRYIGMTENPKRRLMQHYNAAQVWIPDGRPWWVKAPKLRPLYEWVRALYAQERRLPYMLVTAWVTDREAARLAEREHIFSCLARQVPLLNVEREIQDRQLQLC